MVVALITQLLRPQSLASRLTVSDCMGRRALELRLLSLLILLAILWLAAWGHLRGMFSLLCSTTIRKLMPLMLCMHKLRIRLVAWSL